MCIWDVYVTFTHCISDLLALLQGPHSSITKVSFRADQNRGGAPLEFPVITAMHGISRVSSAIKYDFLSWTTLGIV